MDCHSNNWVVGTPIKDSETNLKLRGYTKELDFWLYDVTVGDAISNQYYQYFGTDSSSEYTGE